MLKSRLIKCCSHWFPESIAFRYGSDVDRPIQADILELGQSADNLCTTAHCTKDAEGCNSQQLSKAIAELWPRAIEAAAPQQAKHPELPSRTTRKDTSETWTCRRVSKTARSKPLWYASCHSALSEMMYLWSEPCGAPYSALLC